jgi:hypothetical protein
VYSRLVDGREVTFGVSGKLLMNVLVMYDRQTGSLWSQLLGKAVEGDLEGTELEFFPSWQTTWEEWKTRYPDTLALVKGYKGNVAPYDPYSATEGTGVLGEDDPNARFPHRQFVVGVALGGEAVAYPWSELSLEPVVNDVVGSIPVLVAFDDDTATGVVFGRDLGDQTLTFSLADAGSLALTDVESGSTWDGLTGRAIDGPLAGEQLARVKSTNSFWSGWKDQYPETRVYRASE